MREYEIGFKVRVYSVAELDARDAELIDAAMRATETSYSPYSHFEVGAAIRLESGEIVMGSNQENASYPVGCCAERTALFWCGANRRDEVIEALAIAARTGGEFTGDVTGPWHHWRIHRQNLYGNQGAPPLHHQRADLAAL